MNRIAFATVAGALVSLAALGGATAANASTFGHVSVNIGLPTPPMAVVRPAPVMVQPAPVYHGHDRRDYRQDRGYYRHDRGYYRHDRGYYGTRWDRDGDGVPNRYDRRPMNPYRN